MVWPFKSKLKKEMNSIERDISKGKIEVPEDAVPKTAARWKKESDELRHYVGVRDKHLKNLEKTYDHFIKGFKKGHSSISHERIWKGKVASLYEDATIFFNQALLADRYVERAMAKMIATIDAEKKVMNQKDYSTPDPSIKDKVSNDVWNAMVREEELSYKEAEAVKLREEKKAKADAFLDDFRKDFYDGRNVSKDVKSQIAQASPKTRKYWEDQMKKREKDIKKSV